MPFLSEAFRKLVRRGGNEAAQITEAEQLVQKHGEQLAKRRRRLEQAFRKRHPAGEEQKPIGFNPDAWPPIRIGAMLMERYRVVAKLGFGRASTVWFCADVVEKKYIALKIYTNNSLEARNEMKVFERLDTMPSTSAGWKHLRACYDKMSIQFYDSVYDPNQAVIGKIKSPADSPKHAIDGLHICILHKPLGLSLQDYVDAWKGQVPLAQCKLVVRKLLRGVDCLHREAMIIHTDISLANVLSELTREEVDSFVAEAKASSKHPIKTRQHSGTHGVPGADSQRLGSLERTFEPVLGNFGRARVCQLYTMQVGQCETQEIRAPEMELGYGWDYKVDIWAMGLLTWHLVTGKPLFGKSFRFNPCYRHDPSWHYMAQVFQVCESPGRDFLNKAPNKDKFFDPYRLAQALERNRFQPPTLTRKLDVVAGAFDAQPESEWSLTDQKHFLDLISQMLKIDPAARTPASRLLMHPWFSSLGEPEQSQQAESHRKYARPPADRSNAGPSIEYAENTAPDPRFRIQE